MKFYRPVQFIIRHVGIRGQLFLLAVAHLFRRRYVGLFVDPVLACNLRCRMCYFSDVEHRKQFRGERLGVEALALLRQNAFPRALKLQLGCGAEPTLHSGLEEWITVARREGIPFISLVTNGQLLSSEQLQRYVEAGLNELILSMHGVTASTYEWLMRGAKHERFVELLGVASQLAMRHPHFAVRINYTFNADNFSELSLLPSFLSPFHIATLQLRPVQSLGHTQYQNFSFDSILPRYETVFMPMVRQMQDRGTTVLFPTLKQLTQVAAPVSRRAKLFEEATYYYISARAAEAQDFLWREESLDQYTRRKHLLRRLLAGAVLVGGREAVEKEDHSTRKMNYTL